MRVPIGAVAFLIVVIAVVVGFRIPLQLLPEVQYPQVRVISDLPGQTSAVIEEAVNEPLESALGSVPGLVRMESRSGDGRSYVDLFFEPETPLDRAVRDVTQGVQRARNQMPAGLPEPRIFEVSTTQEPAMHFAFSSADLTPADLRERIRGSVVSQIRSLKGVEMVFIGREEIPELVVEVDPIRQRTLGVDIAEIETLLIEATAPPVSGRLASPGFEGVGVLGADLWKPEKLVHRTVATPHGYLPLGAVADVFQSPSENSLRTRLDQSPAVLMTIFRSPSARATQVSKRVSEVIDLAMTRSAMEGVSVTLLFDDAVMTRSAINSVWVATGVGVVLAMSLVWWVLRQGRRVFVVGIALAVALSGALIAIAISGMTLNLLTLAALLISVGLSLDYGIIYFDRLERTEATNQPDAPTRAMADVASPLLGALLTTIAAVAPFLLVEGLIAQLFRPLILTIIFSSIFAYLTALVILPAFTEHRSLPKRTTPTARQWPNPIWRIVRKGWIAWPIFAGLWLLMIVLGRWLAFEVLPTVDDGFIDMRIIHPAGITQDEMDQISRELEYTLMGIDGTAALFTTVGGYFREGLPAFRPGTANFKIRVDTKSGARPSAAWAQDARTAIDALGIRDMNTRISLPRIRGVRTRLSESDIEVVITDAEGDLIALSELEVQVEDALAQVEGLTDIERMRGGVSARWRVDPDYQAMAYFDVSHNILRKTLGYAMEGEVLRQRMQRGDPLALRARYDRRQAGGPESLQRVAVPSGDGNWIHLSELATFRLVEEPTHIERRENQRVVRVGAQLDPEGPGPAATAAQVEARLAQLDFPDGVSWWLEGEVEALETTRKTFIIALSMALLIVLVILVVQYGSLLLALAGWLMIPLTALGAVLMLTVMNRPLDAMVLAGILISIGIVANSVILVITEATWNRKKEGNNSAMVEEAFAKASRNRLRPISLTVASTCLGMSPLLLGGSEVFGLLQPLAIALTGALLISIPIACLLLPGVYLALERVLSLMTDRVDDR